MANDLALLRVDLDVPASATFRKPSPLTDGEVVAVVGYPFHGRVAIKPIVTSGKVMGIRETNWPDTTRFRIRADIRHGNSGGPILDDQGLVIGVVTAKVDTPKMFKLTGRVIGNVGLAIDRSAVFRFLGRHGVTVRLGSPGRDLARDDLAAQARSIVAQVGCWK